ncbi:hypothetical protein PCE1_000438 [Barthelona sp. PCE]
MSQVAKRRLMAEWQELKANPVTDFHIEPCNGNLFDWHFTFKGLEETDYDGGLYHGRISVPPSYPLKPVEIYLLSESGRWETNSRICMSNTGFHPEEWNPTWNLRNILVGLRSFMVDDSGIGAVGYLHSSSDVRKRLANRSHHFYCEECSKKLHELIKITDPEFKENENLSIAMKNPSTVSSLRRKMLKFVLLCILIVLIVQFLL